MNAVGLKDRLFQSLIENSHEYDELFQEKKPFVETFYSIESLISQPLTGNIMSTRPSLRERKTTVIDKKTKKSIEAIISLSDYYNKVDSFVWDYSLALQSDPTNPIGEMCVFTNPGSIVYVDSLKNFEKDTISHVGLELLRTAIELSFVRGNEGQLYLTSLNSNLEQNNHLNSLESDPYGFYIKCGLVPFRDTARIIKRIRPREYLDIRMILPRLNALVWQNAIAEDTTPAFNKADRLASGLFLERGQGKGADQV